jgi:hypothetical protein
MPIGRWVSPRLGATPQAVYFLKQSRLIRQGKHGTSPVIRYQKKIVEQTRWLADLMRIEIDF